MPLANSPNPQHNAGKAPLLVSDSEQPNGAKLFTQSAERIIDYLSVHTPFTDWSVSRVTRDEQIHVHVHHRHKLLTSGDHVAWKESFCHRMLGGAAHIVRDSSTDSNYSDLKAAGEVGAYAGYAIGDDHGELFGVLCGVRQAPLRVDEEIDGQLVNLFSELLATQLALSLGIERERRRNAQAEALAHLDALTGLLNRRGLENIMADAQEKIEAFGDSVAVAILDLDDLKAFNDSQGHAAGDNLIKRAAEALVSAGNEDCHIARFGGDEFVILLNGIGAAQAGNEFDVFARSLADAGVRASLGFATAELGRKTVQEAMVAADRMMYESKRKARNLQSMTKEPTTFFPQR